MSPSGLIKRGEFVMTPLRQTMIQAMCQHGFSPRTQQSYLYVVTALARYYRRSPDQLQVDDLQTYFNYLVQERSLSPASCRVYLHGVLGIIRPKKT
jgi:hypothetical protein